MSGSCSALSTSTSSSFVIDSDHPQFVAHPDLKPPTVRGLKYRILVDPGPVGSSMPNHPAKNHEVFIPDYGLIISQNNLGRMFVFAATASRYSGPKKEREVEVPKALADLAAKTLPLITQLRQAEKEMAPQVDQLFARAAASGTAKK